MTSTNFKKLSREMSQKEGLHNSVIMVSIAAFVVFIITWASYAELDNVARGNGKIVSSLPNQMVQAAEAGVILTRNVLENSLVREGDVLYEIDPVEAQAEYSRLSQRAATLKIREARLKAEIDGIEFTPSSEFATASPETAQTEQALFAAKRNELNGSLAILLQQKAQRDQSLLSAQQTLNTAKAMSELVQKEISVVEPLVKQNIAPETRLLELRREEQRNLGEVSNSTAQVAMAQAAIAEINSQIENVKASHKREAMEELNAVVAERSELDKALPAMEERVRRTVIRAPVDGIVNRINFRTTGAYVKAGDVILELVPTGEGLKVEAKIDTKDISSIRLDDPVRIRLTAYDSSRYGAIEGHVLSISPDAITDEKGSAQSYYLVDVSLDSDITLANGDKVELMPGMTSTVDVVSGKRTVLEYLWQPIARVQELALRD